jgi:hypothetical protein
LIRYHRPTITGGLIGFASAEPPQTALFARVTL